MVRKKVASGGGDVAAHCMSRILMCTLATVVLLASLQVANGVAVPEAHTLYVVALHANQPVTTLGYEAADLSTKHDLLLESTLGSFTGYRKTYDYTQVMDGFAVKMSSDQAALLRNLPQVRLVEESKTMHATTTHTYDYMGLPGGAWNKSGGTMHAGEDVVIGIVDTGIYPDHPSFANESSNPYFPLASFLGTCETDPAVPNGFCNGKIIAARHFFQGVILSGGNASDPDLNSPLDGAGHGTHCAGTSAGNYGVPVIVKGVNYGNASGVAPRARLAIYKALDSKGSGTTADIIMAVEQAVADKVDILSLSIGPSEAPVGNITFTDSFELALLGAVKQGVFVAQAGGNKGPGASTITSWSPWITTVAASTTDRTYPNYLYLGNTMNNLTGVGFAPQTPGALFYPTVFASDAVVPGGFATPGFDCGDPTVLDKNVVNGKILVCSYDGYTSVGGSLSNLSSIAGQLSGAAGVVLLFTYEYQPATPSFFNSYPVILITGVSNSQAVLNFYQAATVRNASGAATSFGAMMRFTGGTTAVYSGVAPQVASFSARGPDLTTGSLGSTTSTLPVADVLKPNVLAPGEAIWSAWSPLSTTEVASFVGEKFCMISGTSMATPHIAGVGALLKQNHRDWTPGMIASAVYTNAIPSDGLGNALLAYDKTYDAFGNTVSIFTRPGNSFDFGSGFVNAYAALDPGLIFNITYDDYIKFMCATGLITPTNVTAYTTATCPASPGLPTDLNLPSITVGHLVGTRVIPRTVTNVGALEMYTVDVAQPTGVNVTVDPVAFNIAPGMIQLVTVTLTAVANSTLVNQTSFGRIFMTGSLGHRVQVPVQVVYTSTV